MATGHVLLGLLRRGRQHGYDLKRHHDELFPDAKPIAFGQVYTALGRLADRGLVEEAATEQEGGPERTVYALTSSGQAELEEWVATAEAPSTHLAHPLSTRVLSALLAGGQPLARAALRNQREAHMHRMRELTGAKRGANGAARTLDIDHALGRLDADVRWMETAGERLDDIERELA